MDRANHTGNSVQIMNETATLTLADVIRNNSIVQTITVIIDRQAVSNNGLWNTVTVALGVLLLALFGFAGNSLILVCFQKVNRLKNLPTRPLVQSLSVLDILQNGIFDTLMCYYILGGYNYRPPYHLCIITHTVGAIAFPGGYWSVCGISIVRFSHCRGYSVYFKHKNLIISILLVFPWLAGGLVGLIGITNLLNVEYDEKLFVCLYKKGEHPLVESTIYCLATFLPICITVTLNVLLCYKPGSMPLTKEQRSILNSNTKIFLLMMIFNCPFLVLMLAPPNVGLPLAIYPWISLFGCLNSSTNAVVYGFYSHSFRKSVCMVLKFKSFNEINNAQAPRCRIRFVARQSPSNVGLLDAGRRRNQQQAQRLYSLVQ